ncbi:MAG: aryl-sulfate sulfotransferase [Candidatus Helarchaeota archaeon]
MKRKYIIIVFISIISFNILFMLICFEFSPVRAVLDVDQLTDGNYLTIEGMSSSPFSIFTNGHISDSRVLILNRYGQPIWIYDDINDPLGFAHEGFYMNTTNTILIADTDNDRVIEIAIENKSKIWEWNARDINWTDYNPNWAEYEYIQNPALTDWTHINHVIYVPEHDSLLLSLRNLDLLIEIAHNSTKNLIWYFGEPGNHSLLHHQHNPEILPNGNILVSDSENNRIIEINYTSKEIVWSWDNNGLLRWPRDSDYISSGLYTGCYLITDSMNSRLIILDPVSKEIRLIISSHLIVPYEADYIPGEDCFLVGNSFNTQIVKFNNQGIIVFVAGIPIIGFIMIFNGSILVLYYAYRLYVNIYKKGRPIRNHKNIECLIYIGLFLFCTIIYNVLFSILFQVVIFPIMETGPFSTPNY